MSPATGCAEPAGSRAAVAAEPADAGSGAAPGAEPAPADGAAPGAEPAPADGAPGADPSGDGSGAACRGGGGHSGGRGGAAVGAAVRPESRSVVACRRAASSEAALFSLRGVSPGCGASAVTGPLDYAAPRRARS
ncbi:hypothetical protein KRMM14A1259_36000 [Krasilnikovia sp. MM14-A1259]